MNTTHSRFFINNSPQEFKMDYNSEGEWENETGWTNFDDNNYPIKILPHVPVDGGNIFDSDIKRTDNGQTLSFSNYGFYKMN